MEVEEFQRILSAGLGRAILYLRDHDATPYRTVILHDCIQGGGYDRQVEGSRAEWLFELIQLTNEQQWYRDRIIAAFIASPDEEEYDTHQLFEFAWLFAEHGDAEARHAIYTTFARSVAERDDDTGAGELVELDGLEGFVFVADCLGRRLPMNPDSWTSDLALSLLEKRLGEGEATEAVQRAATENPAVAGYLSAVRQRRARYVEGGRRSQRILNYDEIKEIIRDPNAARRTVTLLRWGQKAPDNDVIRAAHDFLQEEDLSRLYGYVTVFTKRAFPLTPEKLIALACSALDRPYEARTADINARVALRSWNVLQLVRHPSVRAFSLQSLQSVHWADRAVGLLMSNYVEGDQLLIEECLTRHQDSEWVHDVGFDALKVFGVNPTPDSVAILQMIYERTPCSVCRGRCVEQLIALGQLPAWMAEECRLDANEAIRERVAKYLGNNNSSA
ncbi:MAG: hypothetical protein ACR2JW_22045 [Thermomicrobiales bacterium]